MQLGMRAVGFLQALLSCSLLLVAAGGTKKKPPAHPLDLNAATVEQLQQLPGIGPATAKAIVRFREKSGPFRRIEDLLAIRGITKTKLEKLRRYVEIKRKEPKADPPGGPAKSGQLKLAPHGFSGQFCRRAQAPFSKESSASAVGPRAVALRPTSSRT
jgi:competence ComEA-like helix-hairpin-helix protein